jgi:hypothetical protein
MKSVFATRPASRTAAAIAAAAVVASLAAACGGNPPAAGTGGAPSPSGSAHSQLVAFSQCMRSNGVPNFPDPDPGGGSPPKGTAQQFGVSGSQFQAAQRACQHLLPNAESLDQRTEQCMMTGDCPQALVQQVLTVERSFARCMRARGVPNWPDPAIDTEGRPVFDISSHGITRSERHSPRLEAKMNQCERATGSPVPMG